MLLRGMVALLSADTWATMPHLIKPASAVALARLWLAQLPPSVAITGESRQSTPAFATMGGCPRVRDWKGAKRSPGDGTPAKPDGLPERPKEKSETSTADS